MVSSGKEGRASAQPSRPDPGSTRHVPPASMALSPPHSTPQHPAARAHTFGLTVHDELNHTSRTPALCVRIQAPSRHMTKHRSGGIPSPFTKGTGIHALASPWSPTSGEPHSLPPLQTKAGPRLREGYVTSPSPLSTSADSEHPSTGEMVSEHLQSGHRTFQGG